MSRAGSRREVADALVVGAGIVGAAAALALAKQGRRVQLIERAVPPAWSAEQPDLRVLAFAPDNARLLEQHGVWSAVEPYGWPYYAMRVWDAGGGGELHFSAEQAGLPELGWIAQNALLVDRLWQAVRAESDIRVHCPASVVTLEQDDQEVRIELDDGLRLRGHLLLAADGAGSPLRAMLGIECDSHDYQQSGLVAYVESERDTEHTCYQRFLPSGPLAFLPVAKTCSSIVWSLPSVEAERLSALEEGAFVDELERALDGRLGGLRLVSARRSFPLRRQLAKTYQQGRCLLIGDAAHVVHPLAGQGVNLGLRDVAELLVRTQGRDDLGDPHRLAAIARHQRSANAVAAYSFDGLNRLFSNDALLPTLLRGPALGLVDKIAPLKAMFLRRAVGR
ncbi:FAD-dependent oxidoreductase [Pseudomarimonas arenosa]|uniref:FAD-dependent oxidoreductase n=1 Tax=Pseudomarimonas arenosa TaxID=2774145 RepID=A0AAW3ZLA5_9GAMM|nr:FAD-dependent oxidoreductase [Pseudomarimonas arenosa]MBD8525954.1 FAD-dependent oxidoreductase [Pseudomarimonas arenosa]